MEEVYRMQLALYAEFYENEHGHPPRRVWISVEAWESLGRPDILLGMRVHTRQGIPGIGLQPKVENPLCR